MADLTVVIASGIGAFAGGGLGATASLLVARVRERSARREEWFRRFQHISGLVLSTVAGERDAGLALLRVLIGDPLASETERRLGETLYAEVLHSGELGDLLERYDLDEEDLLGAVEGPPAGWPPLILEDDDNNGGRTSPGPTDPGGEPT